MTTFKEKVLQIVKKVPKGKSMSYKEVATRAGSPNAARAVGSIMKNNTDNMVPCHRVIKSNGKLGEYNGLKESSKKELLNNEGYVHERPAS